MTKLIKYKSPEAAYGPIPVRVNSKDYIKVPAVLAKHDVFMNGTYYRVNEDEVAKWLNIPVTNGHPESLIGEASGQSLAKWVIGYIAEAYLENKALKVYMYLDPSAIAPNVLKRIKNGEPMDVSIGVSAAVNGSRELYNVSADHVALLPFEEGACNQKMGCGLRTNKKEPTMELSDIVQALVDNPETPYTEADVDELTAKLQGKDVVNAASGNKMSERKDNAKGSNENMSEANLTESSPIDTATQFKIEQLDALYESMRDTELAEAKTYATDLGVTDLVQDMPLMDLRKFNAKHKSANTSSTVHFTEQPLGARNSEPEKKDERLTFSALASK